MEVEHIGEALDACIAKTGMSTTRFSRECIKLDGKRLNARALQRLRHGECLPKYETAMAIVTALNRLAIYKFNLQVNDLWPEEDIDGRAQHYQRSFA